MFSRKSSFALVSFLFAVLLFVSAEIVSAQQWSQWRGEGRKNRSSETGLFEKWGDSGPESLWTANGLGRGYATVSIADGKIFTSGNTKSEQQVAAYGLDGRQLWATSITNTVPKHAYLGSRTTPTWHDGKVYVVGSNGNICCLNAEDGKWIWSRKFNEWGGKMMSTWGFSESPLVDGDVVVCTPGGPDGMVIALDRKTGEDVWVCKLPAYEDEFGVDGKSLMDGAGYSSVVISEGGGVKQYVQLVGRGLIGIRASDGKLLWRYKRVANGTANIPTSIVDGDYIFTSTSYRTGSALLKLVPDGDGVAVEEQYWLDKKTFANKLGGMTLVDGHIYAGHGNGSGLPICVEMMTGVVKWGPLRAKGKGESSLVYADGHLVWRRQDGLVILTKVNAAEMEVVNTFMPEFQEDNSWAQPVICDGVMYLREQDKLMAFKLK